MARIPRVIIPEIPRHIVNRGNRKQYVFSVETDYHYFLEMLSLFSRVYNVKIISYCLMFNHIHRVAIPPDVLSITKMMIDLQKSYTHMINFREVWRGCLWQGRFFSCPMDIIYTHKTMKYIELNPVIAKIVSDFSAYPFSSSAFHLGTKSDSVIKNSYLKFSPQKLRKFVEKGMEKNETLFIEKKTKAGRPMGDDVFIENLEAITGRVLKQCKTGPKKV